jgi:hypothetical protein
MFKKKILPLVAALAISTSTLVAFNPGHSDATTINVASEVSKAQTKMKAPFDKYYETQHTGKTVKKDTVYKLWLSGQDAYKKTSATIQRYGGKNKSYYQARLDNYKRYLERSMHYVAALEGVQYNYDQFDSAINSPHVDFESEFPAEYSQMKYLRSRAPLAFKNVYGPDVRDVLTRAYTRVLTEKIISIEDEVIVGLAYYHALDQETKAAAHSIIDPVESNLAKVEPHTNYGRQLLEFVARAKEDIELHFP